MKNIIALAFVILACTFSAKAQTPPTGTVPSVTLTCTPPATVGGSGTIAGYNFYKSIAGASYAKINASLATTCGMTDLSVTQGQALSYVATTVDSALHESNSSVAATTTVPTNPNPPTLTISSVAILNENGQDRLQVNWTDTNGAATSVNIFGAQGQVLKQVSQTTANGIYSFAVLIPVQSGSISICDAQGCVRQTFQGI